MENNPHNNNSEREYRGDEKIVRKLLKNKFIAVIVVLGIVFFAFAQLIYNVVKTKEKVSGEFVLIFTCYNLRRAMSIFGVNELISRLKAAAIEISSQIGLILGVFADLLNFVLRKLIFLRKIKVAQDVSTCLVG